MRPLNPTITDRRRAHTNRGGQHPLDDRKSNLTPLHLKILQWVEGRRPGDSRPKIDDMSAFAIDTAVAGHRIRDVRNGTRELLSDQLLAPLVRGHVRQMHVARWIGHAERTRVGGARD